MLLSQHTSFLLLLFNKWLRSTAGQVRDAVRAVHSRGALKSDVYSLRSKLPWCSNSGDEQRAQFSREARPLKRGAVSERGQAAHMLEARERRQAHRLHSDPLAKSHHSSLICAFVSQVYPSSNNLCVLPRFCCANGQFLCTFFIWCIQICSMKNHFLITFSRVAELGGKVVYSVPPSREFRAQTVSKLSRDGLHATVFRGAIISNYWWNLVGDRYLNKTNDEAGQFHRFYFTKRCFLPWNIDTFLIQIKKIT